MYVHVHTRMYWMLLCVLSVQKDSCITGLVTQRVQPWTINLFHEYNKDGDHSCINHGPTSSVATVTGYCIAKTVPMLSSVHLQKEKWLLLRDYHSQTQTWPCCFHPLAVPTYLTLSNPNPSEPIRTWLEVTLQLVHIRICSSVQPMFETKYTVRQQ